LRNLRAVAHAIGKGAIQNERVLVALKGRNGLTSDVFILINRVEIIPGAKGLLLKKEEVWILGSGLIAVDGVEVHHGPGDITFADFSGLKPRAGSF